MYQVTVHRTNMERLKRVILVTEQNDHLFFSNKSFVVENVTWKKIQFI